MMWQKLLLLIGLCLLQGTSAFSVRSDYRSVFERDCKDLLEECRGYPSCCGDLQCYYEDGYGLGSMEGYCVECIDRPLICQRDEQCCGNLICHKDKATELNGVCDILREKDGACHEDKQCVSGDCDLDWHRLWGVCT